MRRPKPIALAILCTAAFTAAALASAGPTIAGNSVASTDDASATVAAAASSSSGPASLGASAYETLYSGATLRIDLHHFGTRAEEAFSLDSLREEGPWAGSRSNLVDETNMGVYLARLYDAATNREIFSRGFASLFGEWRTTDEAKAAPRTMHESVLVPMPRGRAYFTISSRDSRNVFREVFHAEIDPNSRQIVRETRCPREGIIDVAVSGQAAERLDILIVGDGYTAAEAEKFRRDAGRFTRILLGFSPFSENRGRINIRALWAASRDHGTDEPRKGVFRDTAAGTSFNTFDIERYLTAPDNRRLRDLASCAPYDRMLILVNTSRYGGAGIHDLWAVAASDNEYSDYVAIHEFGHALAGLGDEYFTSAVSYNEFYPLGVEPWDRNITALVPDGRPKWETKLTPGVPVPTPPDAVKYGAVTGVFEGAGYAAKGLYRPALNCMMFSKGYAPFDAVCRKGIEDVISHHAGAPSR